MSGRTGICILMGFTLVGGVWACSDDRPSEPTPAPVIERLGVAQNPTNALAAVVSYTVQGGESASALFWSDSGPIAETPTSATGAGLSTIPLLGLTPNATYHVRLRVRGRGGVTLGSPVAVQTGGLPQALQGVHLTLSGAGSPPAGFLLTSVTVNDTAFAVAFDRTGAIRWYRGFPTQAGEHALDCEQQPNGNFTLFVGSSSGSQPVPGRYFEFTPGGDSVGTYGAGATYYTDPHELLVRGDGSGDTAVYAIGYDLRTIDLTSLGGGPSQTVAAHSILRQAPDGAVLFRWSAWDHFTLDDWVARPPNLSQATQLDLDHANSIEIDPAGDYIVSFAAATQVVKIDHATGAIRWRLGGRLNQFTLQNDPLSGFGIQHDVRLLPNGDLLLFDNGNFHNPPESRAVEYRLDTLAMTATLVWESRHSPPVYAPFVGSAQRFQNGHTLVGYGAAGIMTEVTPDGEVVWEGQLSIANLSGTIFYRVRELPSLYQHFEP